ncbi:hypothetical protein ACEWY4_008707 [Coilia grayii]|uniref:Ig-like domain-containing protein n=1 Tax=Coilia grayii TaxID=363190 RepID=A0ABD1KBX8_9TELE
MTQSLSPSQSSVTFTLSNVDSSDQGRYTCAISPYSTHSQPISITVGEKHLSVSLVQPNISVRAPDGGLFWGPQGPEVTRGHSLSILCSTEAQYQGGSFHLLFDGSNTTRTQSALNHSASFYIPELDHSHQGNYSCVYEVTVSSHTFSSNQTEPLTLFVKASLVPIIASGAVCGLFILMVIPAVIYLVKRKTLSEEHTPQMISSAPSGSGSANTYGAPNRPGDTSENENIYMNTAELADNRHDYKGAADDLEDDYKN